jgi:hypothetical protein
MRAQPLLALVALTALAACGGPVRIDLAPTTLTLYGRGQSASVHATPREKSGRPVPAEVCAWSSSDPAIATVSGRHNEATVTSVAAGTAAVLCRLGSLEARAVVAVRTVAKIRAAPEQVELLLADEKAPLALAVQVLDDQGAPVVGRIAFTRCDDEAVCRGDARGQLWATGAGATTATVDVEGVKATVAVKVKDVRTEATRPKILKKGYMEDLEREVRQREAAEAAAALKAAKSGK